MSKNDGLWIVAIVGILLLSGGGAVMSYSPTIRRIARAFAIAERGKREINAGAVPRNNPGDIKDSQGNFIIYPTLDDGWNGLYHQVGLMFSGSHIYDPSMTIAEIAQKYVGTSDWPNWANNVANELGVSMDTPLSEV